MIKYSLPGAFELEKINEAFLMVIRLHPEVLYENVSVEAIYGNPQFCIWDGGRVFSNYHQSTIEEILNTIELYNNKMNLPIRYVFTNSALEEKHFYNRFGNLLMELGINYPNEVVLSNDKFLGFLRERYPNYRYISSTTKCLKNKPDVLAELDKEEYFRVCLDYNLNKDIEFLNSLNSTQKEKVELLINPICGAECPHRKKHYYLNSLYHLNFGRVYSMEGCYIHKSVFQRDSNENNLSYETIKKIYEPLGIEHYKIEGRSWNPIDILLTYTNYMVKPEYKDFVISDTILGLDLIDERQR